MLNSITSERAVLSSVVQYNSEAWIEICDIVNENCFLDNGNRRIFSCIHYIFSCNNNSVIDIASIINAAETIGLKDEIQSDIKYVKSLFNYHIEKENIRKFAQQIRRLEEYRQLHSRLNISSNELAKLTGEEPILQAISVAEQPIFDFTNKILGVNQQTEQIGLGIDEYYEELYNDLESIEGVRIGYPLYEKAIGGLKTGVHVIGAMHKTGKSYAGLNAVSWSSYKEKVPSLLLDTELQREHGQWHRFMARFCNGLTINEIKYGTFLDDEIKVKKFNNAKNILKKIPLEYRNVSGLDIQEIISIMRRWLVHKVGYNNKGKLNKCLIVYDYLKPPTDMKNVENIKEYIEIGLRMGCLHDFCVQYSIPILTFSQLNREQDIAASARIRWYCTSYSVLRKKDQDEINSDGPQNGNRIIKIEDIRHGEGLDYGDYINFHFDGKYSLLKELKTRNQVEAEKKQNAATTDGGDNN